MHLNDLIESMMVKRAAEVQLASGRIDHEAGVAFMLISRIDGGYTRPAPADAALRAIATQDGASTGVARRDFASRSFATSGIAAVRPATAPPTPPSLSDIERTYQMPDDTMIDWSPKVWGLIPLDKFTGTRELTATEGRLLDNLVRNRGLTGLDEFSDIKDDAFETSESRVPPPGTLPTAVEAQIAAMPPEMQGQVRASYPLNDGHTDAFRHAYWSARLSSEFGGDWAEQFTIAHEGAEGNPAIREAMDLYNNEVGRTIAADNPDASPDELADLVEQALDDGRLVVIDQAGHLAWSNTVALGNHGITPFTSTPGVMDRPDGNASAY